MLVVDYLHCWRNIGPSKSGTMTDRTVVFSLIVQRALLVFSLEKNIRRLHLLLLSGVDNTPPPLPLTLVANDDAATAT